MGGIKNKDPKITLSFLNWKRVIEREPIRKMNARYRYGKGCFFYEMSLG